MPHVRCGSQRRFNTKNISTNDDLELSLHLINHNSYLIKHSAYTKIVHTCYLRYLTSIVHTYYLRYLTSKVSYILSEVPYKYSSYILSELPYKYSSYILSEVPYKYSSYTFSQVPYKLQYGQYFVTIFFAKKCTLYSR